jgi:hypothetical protein
MKRISMFLALALITPACDSIDDEPASEIVNSVHIKRTVDEAVIQSAEGEPLWSISPEDLVLDAVEERKLAAQRCFNCEECHIYPDWFVCYGCTEVSCN